MLICICKAVNDHAIGAAIQAESSSLQDAQTATGACTHRRKIQIAVDSKREQRDDILTG